MSHRTRWTHELSAERQQQVGEDDHGSPLYETVDVVGGSAGDPVPVRFRPSGTEFVRTETGERVQRSATVVGRPRLADLLEAGDRLTLEPLAPGADPIADVEVAGIDPQYGRTGRTSTTVRLEDV